MSIVRVIGLTAILVLTATNLGCLFGGGSEVKQEGTQVADTTLKSIEPGKSTSAWVRATLGEPTEKSEIEAGHELWKYNYKETKDSNGYVFLIFGASDSKVTKEKVFIEFKDGVVTRTWRG